MFTKYVFIPFMINIFPHDRGAGCNRHDKDNFSPLLIAASNGHAATIKTLLAKGANLYDTDKNDKTALFWAAEEDNVEAIMVREGQL